MNELSRRTVLRAAGGAAIAAGLARPVYASASTSDGKRVAVLGGGMAGLAAAHELAERGFAVTVYEPKALGGKARSIAVPNSATGGRRALPGEHGFRFFPGFYHHVPDTMRRIPFDGNENGVHDNLVDVWETRSSRSGGRPEYTALGMVIDPREAMTPEGLKRVLVEEIQQKGVSPVEAEFFASRLLVFLTSCDARRFGEWEGVSWWDFVRAEKYSEEYQRVIARGLTRSLVAAKETIASTRTIGYMAEAFVMTLMGRGNDGAADRVLNAPTNEAWIDPWVKHLRGLGVTFATGRVEGLTVAGGKIGSARVDGADVDADWFVSAMPVEKARTLLSADVLALDESLASMRELTTDWMNGIQFYVKQPVKLIRGHVTFVDAPWALTGLTQGQFWADRDFRADYGDGRVSDCLSVDISDWDSPGIVYKKPAKQCTREQIAHEVWAQLKAHLNDDPGGALLEDDNLHSWFLDPAIAWDKTAGHNTNDEPLLVNTVNSWAKRPTARTKIPNLFLAGDYVQTNIDLATMEGANESGRAAVNALLDASGSNAERAAMFKLYRPPEYEPFKIADAQAYRLGLPNVFEQP